MDFRALACPEMTSGGVPAARFARVAANSSRLSEREAQGKPGADCARSTVCKKETTHTGLTGTAETSRLSPRNGFTTYFVLSPVSGVFCHRCLRDTSRKIDATVAAPGPHDFAVRCERFVRQANP